MSTGDSSDILDKVKSLIPKRWFAWAAPLRDAVLGGLSDSTANNYSFYLYAKLQSRIATATGIFLDVIAWDFFQGRFLRRTNEIDTAFKPRIIAEILRPRQTRPAILQMLKDLTGRNGYIIEPFAAGDCGAYGIPTSGYGVAGRYGSLLFHNQIFVTAYRPMGNGIANIAGYGNPQGGYGACGSLSAYANSSLNSGPVSDAEIYQRIAQTVAAGETAWTDIKS
jgi:hypothetical protein